MFPATKFDRAQKIDFVPGNKIDDHPRRHGGKPFEGTAMAAEPGGHRLIPDELDVLVTGEAKRHDEGPGPALPAGRMLKERPGSEIDLSGFARHERQADRGLGR